MIPETRAQSPAMATFQSGGLSLAYDDLPPAGGAIGAVLLVHGFAGRRAKSWRRFGWYAAFARRGWRAIALDLRGHGDSDKPHEASAYARGTLTGDLVTLLDHLGIDRLDVMGYSMGAHLALGLALSHPHRVDRLILGGVGGRTLDGGGPNANNSMTMAEAMRTEDPQSISGPMLQDFRRLADLQGDDRQALAACSEGQGRRVKAADLGAIAAPTLVVAGEFDEVAGDPRRLADAIPGARSVSLPACDHFTAIPHILFKAAVFDFLDRLKEKTP
jgi:pimeloyl-ACP methyl ester carboxylesterase